MVGLIVCSTDAPKRDVINEQVRGGDHKNAQVLDMAGQTAKSTFIIL
jgi:hypothetical protein